MQHGTAGVEQQKAGACLSFYKELGNTGYFGVSGEVGRGNFSTQLPQMHKQSLNLKPFFLSVPVLGLPCHPAHHMARKSAECIFSIDCPHPLKVQLQHLASCCLDD